MLSLTLNINPSCYYINDKIIYSSYYVSNNYMTINPTINMY